ncbi:SPOR domain-containing protein [Aerosakkonemataceae cyanobacterium BLCC-F154]|uniref:SPOR domain-containing protein n=1 Tax=Floridaenema fluviatile BLCC-F154 TaxID=3153640 RepID=A0ABV4YJC7_9CYAN
MNQLSPVEPLPETTRNQPCSPVVQGVLSCLDVQLEEEIVQYRRKRSIKQVRQGGVSKSAVGKKGLDLISVTATESQVHLPTASVKEKEKESVAEPLLNDDSGAEETMPLSGNEETAAVAPVLNGNAKVAGEARLESPSPSLGLGNPVGKRLPDEYLESSEALLNNLEEDEFVEPTASPNNKLMTPLGIGSMLLLLVAAAVLGFVAMNPATISHLAGNKQSESSRVAAGGGKNAGGIPNSPNLAEQEFVDLNLETLATVNPRGSAVSQVAPGATKTQVPVNPPAPLPSPAAVNNRLDLPSALIPPAVQSGIIPPQVAQPPIPTAPPKVVSSPQAAAGSKPGAKKPTVTKKAENKFLVIMSYGGDRSLAQARKVAPKALVRQLKQGKAIQLSAFPDEKAAQKKVQDLKKQGISARVYRL